MLDDPSQQSKINSGIHNQNLLRNFKAINGRYKTGYNIQIDLIGLSQDLITWIDTGRPITGTNVLGFEPKITIDSTLKIYWEPIRQTLPIKFLQQRGGDYDIKRFAFSNEIIYVGKDTLDNQFIRIVRFSI